MTSDKKNREAGISVFNFSKKVTGMIMATTIVMSASAQKNQPVKIVKDDAAKKYEILIGGKTFTTFLYPDTIAKPVLYPIHAANGTVVTRGYPMNPQPNDPTDHPHHLGLWLNFENVNGLDFWNNSFAIPQEKKHLYGSIKTDKITKTSDGAKGEISYHANWTDSKNDLLLEETTKYEFSGNEHQRIIDRVTTLTANQQVIFKDAKDGFLGLRVAHALEIPSKVAQKFTDDKGNVTVVEPGKDKVPNGNYITSENITGDDAWSTRAKWCKLYGKMGNDTISITIIDHPKNINYPTYWHARGYGLFAANPLGENIFTKGKTTKNLTLQKGETVTFRYRVVIDEGKQSTTNKEIERLTSEFAKTL